jgi:hypothetical protein
MPRRSEPPVFARSEKDLEEKKLRLPGGGLQVKPAPNTY